MFVPLGQIVQTTVTNFCPMGVTIGLTQLKRKKRKDGTIPIYIRVTEDRKSRYKSTGIAVKKSEWLKKDKLVSSKHRRADHLNMKLKKQLRNVQQIEERLYKEDRLSRDAIMAELSEDHDPRSVIQQAKEYKKHLQSEDRYWAQRHFSVMINNLESYINDRGKPDQIGSLNAEWIEDFQDYLLSDVGNGDNTVRKKMQRLKGMTDWLLKAGKISSDPFQTVEKVKREKTNSKVKLSFKQIEAIEKLDLEKGSRLWHVRNYFMYSFYNAGIRFGDLCTLKWSNIVDGRLKYEMAKTGSEKSIKQRPPMKRILDHYRTGNEDPEDYIFPILERTYSDPMELRKRISSNNVQTNNRLKVIAEKAGIQANISFHVSRHSFAHYALKKGMDLYAISKALGHSELRITEEYIKSFDEELLDNSMAELF